MTSRKSAPKHTTPSTLKTKRTKPTAQKLRGKKPPTTAEEYESASSSSAKKLFDSYRERSTALLKAQSDSGMFDDIFDAPGKYGRPSGTIEPKLFSVGQRVRATGRGSYIAGYEFEITAHHYDGRWARYYGAGVWHRTMDIEAISD